MVESFFAYEQIQPQYYKSDPYVFFFDNPFKKTDPDQPAIFRKATFNTDLSSFRDDLTLLSIKHPFVQKLFELAPEKFHNSDAAALELKLSKFAGKSGLLFYYLFEMSNQIDKDYKELIPVFIDFETNRFNRRISNIFLNLERMEITIIPKYKPLRLEQDYLDEARQAAQKEAEEIYFAKKLQWNRQIDKHTEKIEEYYGLKKQAVEDIRIENIRTARLKDLYKQYEQEMDLIKKKKNIVPNLQALQTAYIEVKS